MSELLLAERETAEGTLVSVCDPDVVGRTFREEGVTLEVDAEFYAADAREAGDDAVVDSLARCTVANLVGERAVGLAVEHGFVDEGNVLEFEETRHAQYLRL